MKQTEKLLMTTMTNSLFNISGSPNKLSQRKKLSTPNKDLEKSRSITYRSISNYYDISHCPSISSIRKPDSSLHERLYNQAKEIKEKIDIKQNELLEQIKRKSIPKIHQVSKRIERKQELFPERLYPYHKLFKLDTDEDNSFEYAHVATVRSNPMGISGEFDNDDYRNNLDSIFCDDEEIRNLYGNKPSYVKIYRGIKYHKREKYSFKPNLSKKTYQILNNMENSNSKIPLKKQKSGSIEESQNTKNEKENVYCNKNDAENYNSNLLNLTKTNSDSRINYNFNKFNNANSSNIGNNNNNNNLINIDFIYDEIPKSNINNNYNTYFQNNNHSNLNPIIPIRDINNTSRTNDIHYAVANVKANLNFFTNNQNVNTALGNTTYNQIEQVQNIINQDDTLNYVDNIENSLNKKKSIKKTTANYFEDPADRIKSRYEMEIKKSYTSYYNAKKNEKINQKSINISNKLYNQGISSIKKKEKINEEKQKADLEEYKNHSFKPKLNLNNFQNSYNNSNNNINYTSSNSSIIHRFNNISEIVRDNYNVNVLEQKSPKKNFSRSSKSGLKSNISKKCQLSQNSNDISNTCFKTIEPKGAYSNYTNNPNKTNDFKDNNSSFNCKFSTNANSSSYNTVKSNNQLLNNSYPDNAQIINNDNYAGEELKVLNKLNSMKISSNSIKANSTNNKLDKGSLNRKYSDGLFKKEKSRDLPNSISTNFFDKSIKRIDIKDQKPNKLREEKSKDETKNKSKLSPKVISKSKNSFDDKFSLNQLQKSNSFNKFINVQSKKEQEKNFESQNKNEDSINSNNSKIKITHPQKLNLSQIISKNCRENLNKAKVLHRTDSLKNNRGNLSTNIFFNQAVFEIEENMNNFPNNENVNVKLNNNNNNNGAYEKFLK